MYQKNIKSKKNRLRKLQINDYVLIPKGRIRKSDYPNELGKVTKNEKPYFERNILLKIKNIIKNSEKVILY